MKLSKEEALRLHRKMWSDMQKELGDCPSDEKRVAFKKHWCESHGYNVSHNCFLCEYDYQIGTKDCLSFSGCRNCPIKWPNGTCYTGYYYYFAPISEILALEES